ncbi:hypothetical protein D030_1881B, partial [Vibrio parahaemolyticus AQ3810]
QHVFTHKVERKRSVYRVTKRVKDRR